MTASEKACDVPNQFFLCFCMFYKVSGFTYRISFFMLALPFDNVN